jgi:hypothetical protein
MHQYQSFSLLTRVAVSDMLQTLLTIDEIGNFEVVIDQQGKLASETNLNWVILGF